jgi:protein TonB
MNPASTPSPRTWGETVASVRDADLSPAALAPVPTATGSQLLQRSYKGNLASGLALAVAIHAAALGLYKVTGAEAAPLDGVPPVIEFTGGRPLPPPLDPPDEPPGPAAPAPPTVDGIPEGVPTDEVPPDQPFAGQEQVPDPGLDGAGTVPGGVVDGTGTIPAPPPLPVDQPRPVEVDVPDDEPRSNAPLDMAEVMPELLGGLPSIRPEYPEMERRAQIEGRVFLQFVVNEDGTVSEVRVTRGVSPGLDAAAVAAVRRARFLPGRQNGRPVRVRFSLPINFRLN